MIFYKFLLKVLVFCNMPIISICWQQLLCFVSVVSSVRSKVSAMHQNSSSGENVVMTDASNIPDDDICILQWHCLYVQTQMVEKLHFYGVLAALSFEISYTFDSGRK